MNGVVKGLGILALVIMTGCASIVSKSTWPVTITSTPPGATVSVRSSNGLEVHRAQTPTMVMLPSGDGYFGRAKYTLTFEKDGYAPATASLTPGINGWYFANILFGGLIGMVIVDPLTGAMWRQDEVICVSLPEASLAAKPSAPQPAAQLLPPPKADSEDIVAKLKQFKELKESGVITEDEYQAKKKALLDKM